MRKPLAKFSALTCISLLLIACGDSADVANQEPPLRLVRTLTIAESSEQQWREFPAVVDALKKADLGFRVSGELRELLINEGERVEDKQLLARLDATDYEIQLKSREAEYSQAHADFLRGQSLIGKGLISKSDYNKLEAQDSVAKAALEAARQNMEYTYLRAPFAGQIAKRYIENYEEVSAMQPVFALQDTSAITIKVNIAESLMTQVRESDQPEVYALFDFIPDRQFLLEFKEVATQADETTNTFEVTFVMDPVEGYNILPGMSVTVRGVHDTNILFRKSPILVPAHAVLEDTEGRHVYVVNSTEPGLGSVERRAVVTDGLTNNGIRVSSGLSVGDQLIIAGMSKMYPGLNVRVRQENLD